MIDAISLEMWLLRTQLKHVFFFVVTITIPKINVDHKYGFLNVSENRVSEKSMFYHNVLRLKCNFIFWVSPFSDTSKSIIHGIHPLYFPWNYTSLQLFQDKLTILETPLNIDRFSMTSSIVIGLPPWLWNPGTQRLTARCFDVEQPVESQMVWDPWELWSQRHLRRKERNITMENLRNKNTWNDGNIYEHLWTSTEKKRTSGISMKINENYVKLWKSSTKVYVIHWCFDLLSAFIPYGTYGKCFSGSGKPS